MTTQVFILFILTSIFTFYLGYNDGANAIATTVATHALTPRKAVIVAAVTKFVAPIIMFYTMSNLAVANTIGKDIIISSFIDSATVNKGFLFLLSGLIAALIWGTVTYFTGLPNSASHTLLGGIIGAACIAFGYDAIRWNNVLINIVLMVILAPVLGLLIGYLFMLITKRLVRKLPSTVNWFFKFMQRINVIVLTSSIAINNVQKSIGVYFLILTVCKITLVEGLFNIWIVIIFALLLVLGLLIGGFRIVNTVGNKIFKLLPIHSVIAQLSTGAIVFGSSLLGVPVSTGQVVSSTIMGVGANERISGVQWLMAKKIFISWFITFPMVGLMGGVIYFINSLIFGGSL